MKAALVWIGLLCAALAAAQWDMSTMMLTKASPVMAMSRQDVKKELKLSKDQDKAISQIVKEFQGSTQTRGNDPNSWAATMQTPERMKEASDKVVALLDDAQRQRLYGIRIQMMGPPGLQDPDVAKDLGLSDDQKSQVKQLEGAYWDQLMGLMRSAASRGTTDKIKKMRTELDGKELAVLTDAQRAKFQELQGAPFKNARPTTGF